MARRSMGGRRMHVILTKPQDVDLHAMAKETELPVAEHVRRAIDIYRAAWSKQKAAKK